MLLAFNIIFWGYMSRVLGGLYTKPNTTENAVSRYISLPICFVVLALQMPDLVHLGAWCFAFCVIRLRSTVPLLDLTYPDRTDEKIRELDIKVFWRNLPIVLVLPFTSYWLALFLAQGVIYFYAGKLSRKYPKIKAVTLSEVCSGILFALCLSL